MNKIWLFPIIMLIHSVALASPTDKLSTLLGNLKTMESSFKQTVYDNNGKAIQTSYGKMALNRPGKFRWEVKKPIPQLIVANNKKLWIYDPDLDQVTIKKLNRAAGDTPALLLSHVSSVLDKNYQVSEKEEDRSELRWFVLKPKNSANLFEQVEMGFKGNKIEQMRLQDHLGHVTGIKFSKITTNKTLPASLFTFKPPRGVDVIDETRR